MLAFKNTYIVIVLMFKVNGYMVDLRKSKMQNDRGKKERFEDLDSDCSLSWKLQISFSGLYFLNWSS